jgi:hypothetical protein
MSILIHALTKAWNCLRRHTPRQSATERLTEPKANMNSPVRLESQTGPNLEYVFSRIVLTRHAAGVQQTRTGPGTVVRKSDGALELRMFASERVTMSDVFHSVGQAGQLLSDEAFFKMSATAANGTTWTSERLMLSENAFLGAEGSDVRANLPFLASSSPPFVPQKVNSYELVVHTSAQIPCNDIETRGSSSSMSRLNLTATDGSSVSFFQRNGHLLVVASNAKNTVDVAAISRLLEGIAVVTGNQVTVSSEITRTEHLEVTKIYAVPMAHLGKTLWPPIDPRQVHSRVRFISAYAEYAQTPDFPFFDAWLSILAAWDQGLIASSLPLGVGVERMLRTLFTDKMEEERIVRDAADAMAKHLETAPVSEEMKKRGKGAISSIKGKSPSAALKSLAAEGWFSDQLEPSWRAVRNRAAHGSALISAGQSAAEMQSGLDNMLRCLHLFYVLLLVYLKFSDEFTDHSVHGFPDTKLPSHLLSPLGKPMPSSESVAH